jgi:hypothetical protein
MHHASPSFWTCYHSLPEDVRKLADHAFARLKQDRTYPALRFKKIGRFWSARVGGNYRALAIETRDGFVWFRHADYDKLVG